MKFKITILVLLLIGCSHSLQAKALTIFRPYWFEKAEKDSFAFCSLSELYPLSEQEDSLAVPDLRGIAEAEMEKYVYIHLSGNYRNQFLTKTKISESDKVFLYSYATNKLMTFLVKDLKVVAFLTPYGAEWPYKQEDYMIGFEFPTSSLFGFELDFENSLVAIGKNNPFVSKQMQRITWKKIPLRDFPLNDRFAYDSSYTGKCVPTDAYTFETTDYVYYLKDFKRVVEDFQPMKRLVIKDKKTNLVVIEKLFYSGESASFTPLDDQWTGKLFKQEAAVILGFLWESFGCERITFLEKDQPDLILKCDNRH